MDIDSLTDEQVERIYRAAQKEILLGHVDPVNIEVIHDDGVVIMKAYIVVDREDWLD